MGLDAITAPKTECLLQRRRYSMEHRHTGELEQNISPTMGACNQNVCRHSSRSHPSQTPFSSVVAGRALNHIPRHPILGQPPDLLL